MQEEVTNQKDEEIVTSVVSGNKEVFGVLIERYESKLSRYLRRFTQIEDDVTDILQVIFIKTYTNLLSFDTSRSFNSWIYRIAHNEAVNHLKKHGSEKVSFMDFDTLIPYLFAEEDTETLAEKEETKKLLENALKKLSPKYREILILYYYDDLSYEEIAEVLHVPIGTVGVRVKRGRDALRNVLQENNHYYDRT